MFSRTLSFLFPPRPERLSPEDMSVVMEYHGRVSRIGVENNPKLTPVSSIRVAQKEGTCALKK